jgi:hypothetical protein
MMRRLALILAVTFINLPALAAGIDSRTYTCAGLHALIAARGFVFIGNADFEDFVVANVSSCAAGQFIQVRSVATSDQPDCTVNYCVGRSTGGY